MTIERVRRVGGMAGILFVVLALVAFFLPGEPPKADDAPAEVTKYFIDKRDSILAADFLLGFAALEFLLFLGCLRVHFGAADRDGLRPGSIALAGGAVGAALLIAGTAVLNGAAFRVAGAGDAALNTALYDVANSLFFLGGFGFAAFFIGAAVAGRATGGLPHHLVIGGYVAAAFQIVSAVGLFAKSGFFATGGFFGLIAVLIALIWVLAASVGLLRAAPAAPGEGGPPST